MLTSRSALPHPGHYLTFIEPASRELTTLGVPGFKEELDVYVADGELRADHAFWLFGLPFLVLRYRIRRKPAQSRPTEAEPPAVTLHSSLSRTPLLGCVLRGAMVYLWSARRCGHPWLPRSCKTWLTRHPTTGSPQAAGLSLLVRCARRGARCRECGFVGSRGGCRRAALRGCAGLGSGRALTQALRARAMAEADPDPGTFLMLVCRA